MLISLRRAPEGLTLRLLLAVFVLWGLRWTCLSGMDAIVAMAVSKVEVVLQSASAIFVLRRGSSTYLTSREGVAID